MPSGKADVIQPAADLAENSANWHFKLLYEVCMYVHTEYMDNNKRANPTHFRLNWACHGPFLAVQSGRWLMDSVKCNRVRSLGMALITC